MLFLFLFAHLHGMPRSLLDSFSNDTQTVHADVLARCRRAVSLRETFASAQIVAVADAAHEGRPESGSIVALEPEGNVSSLSLASSSASLPDNPVQCRAQRGRKRGSNALRSILQSAAEVPVDEHSANNMSHSDRGKMGAEKRWKRTRSVREAVERGTATSNASAIKTLKALKDRGRILADHTLQSLMFDALPKPANIDTSLE